MRARIQELRDRITDANATGAPVGAIVADVIDVLATLVSGRDAAPSVPSSASRPRTSSSKRKASK